MRLQIDIPPGELVDRLTIIQIKANKIKDPSKISHIMEDLRQLTEVLDKLAKWCEGNKQTSKWHALTPLTVNLRHLNSEIWDIEDKIRALEKAKDFGEEFIQTARSVYFTNDKRAEVKRQINDLFNSDIREEKSYTDYA
jgi:hypothetical protein